jgi:hypothetical protein
MSNKATIVCEDADISTPPFHLYWNCNDNKFYLDLSPIEEGSKFDGPSEFTSIQIPRYVMEALHKEMAKPEFRLFKWEE